MAVPLVLLDGSVGLLRRGGGEGEENWVDVVETLERRLGRSASSWSWRMSRYEGDHVKSPRCSVQIPTRSS